MNTVQKLKQLINSDILEYEEELENIIGNGFSAAEFDEFDDYLLELVNTNPSLVKEISSINLKAFKKTKNVFWIGYTYNTLLNSLVYSESIEQILPYFKESLILCIENKKMFSVGHSICSNLKNSYNLFKQDELIEIIKLSIDFYKSYNKNKHAIKNMIHASLIFSGFGAYQSAYRLLSDAENLCVEKSMQQLHANVIATLATVAMEEGDFPYAEGAFQKSFQYYKSINKKIPFENLFNWGTILIRTNKYAEAEETYNFIKSNYSKQKDQRVDLNLAIAYKNQGKYDLALSILNGIESQIEQDEYSEWKIEFYIISSNTFALNSQYDDAVIYLDKSVFAIEKYLDTVSRLHYRRGVREKYYRRIIDIVEIVFPKAKPLNLLNTFIYLKKNSQSDWLAIIEWVKQVNTNQKIEKEDLSQLNDKYTRLINFGGVITASFREKYDDPFESPSIGSKNDFIPPAFHIPWQEFTLTVQKLVVKYDLVSPYELNSIKTIRNRIIEKNNSGSVILFIFLVAGKYKIYNISSDKTNIYEIELDIIIEYAEHLQSYRNPKNQNGLLGESTKDKFRGSLESVTMRLSYIFNDLIDLIITEGKKTITIIPDIFDTFLPLSATFFSIDELVDLFHSGNLSIEHIPVMFVGSQINSHFDFGTVITNSHDSLDLFEEECKLVEDHFKSNFQSILVNKENSLRKWTAKLKKTDCVHIISHGRPISFYTDPAYAALDTESLYLESFQEIFQDSKCKLFILNACNSADTVNRNFHKNFKSYESVSYVSILLQNRKSKVIAAQWPELDTFSFVFTSVFYDKLQSATIEVAFSQTLSEIRKSNKDYFFNVISKIENETIREKKEKMIEYANSEQPFDRVLMYGCLNFYSLL